jgi:hypothetical protein
MGRRPSISQCIRDAESRLAYWQEHEPAMLNAATAGDVVAMERARLRREIDWLKDAAARMGGTPAE